MTQDREHVQSAASLAHQFCAQNSKASTLLVTAAQDYAAARCLLLNHLVSSGLVMGAQAIEKFLKAYILLKRPTENIRRSKHSLVELLKKSDQLYPVLGMSQYLMMLKRYEDYYDNRYPDNNVALEAGMSSAEVFELDEFILFLNDNLSMPIEAKYSTGLYALVTFSLNGGTVTPWEKWIKMDNRAFAPRWHQIEADFLAVLKRLHPNAVAFSKQPSSP